MADGSKFEKLDCTYKPKNPVATFVDEYGEERIIHRPKGKRLSVKNTGDSPVLKMNRAVAILLGRKVRERRLSLGLSQKQLCHKAGFTAVNPKQYIYAIEAATRQEGCRFGTLYALSHALECQPTDLLPTRDEVLAAADISVQRVAAIIPA